MKLVGFIIRHFIPIGLAGAFGLVLFSGAIPSKTTLFQGFGLELSALPAFSPETVASQMDQVASTGIKFIRMEINWSEIENAADTYDWNAVQPLDSISASAVSSGIEVVGVLKGGPVYLAVPGQILDQAVVGERWEAFVRAAAEHFGDAINTWEIGSDINSSRGVSPFLSPLDPQRLLNPDPVFYSKLLRSAARIIREVQPNDTVWMGSLTGLAANDCLMNPLTFLLEVNAAGAWKYADAISYTPRQGNAIPESTPTGLSSSACSSNLMTTPTSMSDEVHAVQDLVRQLGTKPVIITNLDWKNAELKSISNTQSIPIQQLKTGLLTRASVSLIGQDEIPLIFWNMNISKNETGKAALTNLQTALFNGETLGQIQGQTGSVQEYRFRNGGDVYSLAWRTQAGSTMQPVNLDFNGFSALSLFPIDASSLEKGNATDVNLDANGLAIQMLNESPVILKARSGNFTDSLQAEVNQQVEILRYQMNDLFRSWGNQLKGAVTKMLENWFESAKQDAVQWGEGLLDKVIP
jgi:hypothetical protein